MALSRIRLQADGPEVSRLIAGMMRLASWAMNAAELHAWLEKCLELGLTSFDHADIYGDYGCEQAFGEVLELQPQLREKIEIITKCGIQLVSAKRPQVELRHYNTARDHILQSVDKSLKNLHTDYLDVLLIHRYDPLMNADEVASAFTHLKDAGKVRFFGVSNFMPHQFDLLQSRLDFPLVTNQVQFSVMHVDALRNGILDQCQQKRISPMAWSPLGGGAFFRQESEEGKRLGEVMQAIADEQGGAGLDQIALAWILAHPAHVVPVLGTGKIERIQSAVESERITLTRQQWFRILAAYEGHTIV